MWLSDRRTVLALLLAVSVGGCGFQPAYGPGSPARGLFDNVAIDAPTDKNGFDLVERLEERLGRPKQPDYLLSYRIETRSEGLAIAPDNAIIRYQVTAKIKFGLKDNETGMIVSDGVVSSFTAYSASGTSVATASSEADAYTRLMRLLADQIATRIIADLSSGRAK
ncbi:MAG: hypothetical protein KDE03_16845 [Rhodobacteraceae bacterium]|nr:hypothetical protein [Paracoccaceae bacterium]